LFERFKGLFSADQRLKNLGYDPSIKMEKFELNGKEYVIRYSSLPTKRKANASYGVNYKWDEELFCIYIDRLTAHYLSNQGKKKLILHEVGHAEDPKVYDLLVNPRYQDEIRADKFMIDKMFLKGWEYKELTIEVLKMKQKRIGMNKIEKRAMRDIEEKAPLIKYKIAYQYACDTYGP